MQANPPAAEPEPPASPPRRQHRVVARSHAPASKSAVPAQAEMQPLNGSLPDYPEAYDDTDRAGSVVVTCTVQTTGRATDCQIKSAIGGPDFRTSVLRWLNDEQTRFPPILKRGRPTVSRFTWTVEFYP